MLSEILTLGDKVDFLFIYDTHISKESERHVSQVIDIHEDNQVSIAMPIDKGRLITMEPGQNYSVCFYTKRGLYQCVCTVVERYKQNNIVAAVIKPSSTLEKFQRRQYYRLEYRIDILYRVISKQETLDLKIYNRDLFETQHERYEFYKKLLTYDTVYEKASMIDISGGGVRFHSKAPIDREDKIILKIDLFDNLGPKLLQLTANIIYTSEFLANTGYYENRVEFIDISKEDREFIIKFVFDEERRKRKKEMG